MDKVIIRDLLAHGIIGINNFERENPQDILINIECQLDLNQPGASDNIEDCLNYSTLADKIKQLVETAQRFTVEALAEDIAGICLEDSRVTKAIVRVEKPNAILYATSAGVEIERSRPGTTNI